MKVLVAVLFVLLCTTALCSPDSCCGQDRVHSPPTCCFTFISQPIPRNLVTAYFKTSQCPHPDIIFLTIKQRLICAKPSDAWVQEYIRDLDQNA
ncbi:C-C motif chemokine 3-like [Choloepus didactylus]|uniref:C-C motif chemokine 3-like n=1 Tax=Choloepus didactylus TaxID=27675 RepID=UPI0018A0F9C0|nr:C-C motif chemokine 3-like [Choloepus didactylus]